MIVITDIVESGNFNEKKANINNYCPKVDYGSLTYYTENHFLDIF